MFIETADLYYNYLDERQYSNAQETKFMRLCNNQILFSFQLCHDTKLSKSLEKMIAYSQAGTRTLAFFPCSPPQAACTQRLRHGNIPKNGTEPAPLYRYSALICAICGKINYNRNSTTYNN